MELERAALEQLDRPALVALVLAQPARIAALAGQVATLPARVDELGGSPPPPHDADTGGRARGGGLPRLRRCLVRGRGGAATGLPRLRAGAHAAAGFGRAGVRPAAAQPGDAGVYRQLARGRAAAAAGDPVAARRAARAAPEPRRTGGGAAGGRRPR